MKNTLNGRISISRYINVTDKSREVSISLVDESSSIHFLDIEMSIMDFGKALFGQSEIPVVYALRGMDRIGWIREHKTEEIRIAHSPYSLPKETVENILKDYEVDGWSARVEDFHNFHNVTFEGKTKLGDKDVEMWVYRINFVRFVEKPDEQ